MTMRLFLCVLTLLSFTANGFPIAAQNASVIASAAATVNSGIDITASIAVVNELVRNESPIAAQVNDQRSTLPVTAEAAVINRCFAGGGRELVRVLGHPFMSCMAVVNDMSGFRTAVRQCGGDGESGFLILSFLSYLIILARANLPWATVTARLIYEATRSDSNDRVFLLGRTV